jgi:hypothetical protein
MKEIVDGKLYDTDAETTEHIATHNPIVDRGDFNFLREELHRTETGQYFIAGEGGAMTDYRKKVGSGEYSGSSEVRVVSDDEAFRWMQSNNINVETILDEFGDRVEEA